MHGLTSKNVPLHLFYTELQCIITYSNNYNF